MLLTRLIRRMHRDETGAAMAAVIGLMAFSLLTSALVVSSVIASTSYTTVTRAGVESQAAAEAGVAAARVGLLTGTCAADGHSYESTAPEFVATVWVPAGGGWTRGCPSGTSVQVRILSTGYAQSEGVVGASGRDVTHLEVVLSAASVPTEIDAGGPAVYAYKSEGFGGGGQLVSAGDDEARIIVKEGDVDCNGGAAGDADIVVNDGDLKVSGGCVLTGNAWVSGRVTMPGGPDIGGSVIADALTISGGSQVLGDVWVDQDVTMSGGVGIGGNVTAQSMSFSSGGTVGGNVQTTGDVVFGGGGGPWIKGNLTAANFSTGNGGTVDKNAWIYGATTTNWGALIKGDLTTKTLSKPSGMTFVEGTTTIIPSGPGASPYATNPAEPEWPTVPEWVDFDYDYADWTGFGEVVITSSGTCSYSQVVAAVASLGGQPGVVNALGCANGISVGGNNTVTLYSDVAIISHRFSFGGSGGFDYSGNFDASLTHRLWLITPDDTPDGEPTCVSGDNSFSVTGGFWFSENLQVMMYTPCKISLASSTTFVGQVFAGTASIAGGAQLGFVPVGLPGYDLDTGLPTTTASTEADRTIVSFRNVQEGNG